MVIVLFLHSRKGVTKTIWTGLEERNLLVGTLGVPLSFILLEDMQRCKATFSSPWEERGPTPWGFGPAVSSKQ